MDPSAWDNVLYHGIFNGDAAKVDEACRNDPSLIRDYIDNKGKKTWLGFAADRGNTKVLSVMLDHGFNIDPLEMPYRSTPLISAVSFNHDEAVELLLTRGANPNIGRPLIGALNCNTLEKRFKYVKLLVEHGADVNRLYDLYGDSNNQFTVLDWANDPEIVDYLREKGAKTAAELKANG
ncbi:Hypothetical protein PBC10988_36710 [Planctomycetales bacterium 10988]|nr:Hypothetical protein PBC10988_36710 [Planctomycetales bacterium 10988]